MNLYSFLVLVRDVRIMGGSACRTGSAEHFGSEMCGLWAGPLAEHDPQNISDPQTDCGSFVDEKLRTWILILNR